MLGGVFDPILNLPLPLGSEILSQWLTLGDVAMLDCASCNKKKRAELMGLLQSHEALFKSTTDRGELFLQWVVLRKIRLSEIRLTSPVNVELVSTLFKKIGQYITRIVINKCRMTENGLFASIALCCPRLKRF